LNAYNISYASLQALVKRYEFYEQFDKKISKKYQEFYIEIFFNDYEYKEEMIKFIKIHKQYNSWKDLDKRLN
jgi:hypothetical protein